MMACQGGARHSSVVALMNAGHLRCPNEHPEDCVPWAPKTFSRAARRATRSHGWRHTCPWGAAELLVSSVCSLFNTHKSERHSAADCPNHIISAIMRPMCQAAAAATGELWRATRNLNEAAHVRQSPTPNPLSERRTCLANTVPFALCITLCWRFGCRSWGWFWEQIRASTAATAFANS